MRKFLKDIIIFLGLTAISFPILILIIGMAVPQMFRPNLIYPLRWKGHLHTRVSEIPMHKNLDVLVMGSSHAYRGFDPRIFKEYGLAMFNLGSSGQTPITGKVLLNRYLEQLNPKILIYVTSAGSFYTDGVESCLDVLTNDHIDLSSVKMVTDVNHLKSYNTLVYSFLRKNLLIENPPPEPAIKEGEKYISGGYVERDERPTFPKVASSQTWSWNSKQLEVFKENLDYIKTRGIKVILVQTPITERYYSAFLNKGEFDQLMEAHGDYYNFNGKAALTDSLHFYDGHHLNKDGVAIFNKYFLDSMNLKSMLD